MTKYFFSYLIVTIISRIEIKIALTKDFIDSIPAFPDRIILDSAYLRTSDSLLVLDVPASGEVDLEAVGPFPDDFE